MKRIILLALFVGFNTVLNAQNIITPPENAEEAAQTQSKENLIIGTWVAEGSDFENRIEIQADGTFIEHSSNGTTSLTWEIYTETTGSGLKISKFKTQGNGNSFSYTIDTLNDERMILVYNNNGHLSRNLYLKQ